jgi:hypothetical protein
MAVWSRDLHGAKVLTIRFESAMLPAAKLLNWQRTSEFNKPEHWIFASSFKAGKKPWQPWGCNSGIFHPQPSAAA